MEGFFTLVMAAMAPYPPLGPCIIAHSNSAKPCSLSAEPNPALVSGESSSAHKARSQATEDPHDSLVVVSTLLERFSAALKQASASSCWYSSAFVGL